MCKFDAELILTKWQDFELSDFTTVAPSLVT